MDDTALSVVSYGPGQCSCVTLTNNYMEIHGMLYEFRTSKKLCSGLFHVLLCKHTIYSQSHWIFLLLHIHLGQALSAVRIVCSSPWVTCLLIYTNLDLYAPAAIQRFPASSRNTPSEYSRRPTLPNCHSVSILCDP